MTIERLSPVFAMKLGDSIHEGTKQAYIIISACGPAVSYATIMKLCVDEYPKNKKKKANEKTNTTPANH
jgi:hypothetical protein